MEKVDFTKGQQSQGSYAGSVQDAEAAMKKKLSPKMFNLGEQLHSLAVRGDVFCPKLWASYAHNLDFLSREDGVIFGMTENPQDWYLRKVFESFHKHLARYFDKKIYYALDGKIMDYANYGVVKYGDLTDEQKKYADDSFQEAKANVRKYIQKSKEAFA